MRSQRAKIHEFTSIRYQPNTFTSDWCLIDLKPLMVAQWCRHIATSIWLNIGSGNGMVPSGTKLPEPMFTSHQWGWFCGISLRVISHLEPKLLFCVVSLTHWGRDKMAAISQTTLSIAFSWMKILEFRLNFHWSLFLRVQLTIFHHWFG